MLVVLPHSRSIAAVNALVVVSRLRAELAPITFQALPRCALDALLAISAQCEMVCDTLSCCLLAEATRADAAVCKSVGSSVVVQPVAHS